MLNDLIKVSDWIRIPTEMSPELPDSKITQFSLISILEWLEVNLVKDKTQIQNLHKVNVNICLINIRFTDIVQKLLVTTYNVYIASHLNLEMEFLSLDDSESAHEWFKQRARSMALNNTEMSLFIPE